MSPTSITTSLGNPVVQNLVTNTTKRKTSEIITGNSESATEETRQGAVAYHAWPFGLGCCSSAGAISLLPFVFLLPCIVAVVVDTKQWREIPPLSATALPE
jgi:hypothetical protein